MDCAYVMRDDHWLRGVSDLCVDDNGCCARVEITYGMVVSYDLSS